MASTQGCTQLLYVGPQTYCLRHSWSLNLQSLLVVWFDNGEVGSQVTCCPVLQGSIQVPTSGFRFDRVTDILPLSFFPFPVVLACLFTVGERAVVEWEASGDCFFLWVPFLVAMAGAHCFLWKAWWDHSEPWTVLTHPWPCSLRHSACWTPFWLLHMKSLWVLEQLANRQAEQRAFKMLMERDNLDSSFPAHELLQAKALN